MCDIVENNRKRPIIESQGIEQQAYKRFQLMLQIKEIKYEDIYDISRKQFLQILSQEDPLTLNQRYFLKRMILSSFTVDGKLTKYISKYNMVYRQLKNDKGIGAAHWRFFKFVRNKISKINIQAEGPDDYIADKVVVDIKQITGDKMRRLYYKYLDQVNPDYWLKSCFSRLAIAVRTLDDTNNNNLCFNYINDQICSVRCKTIINLKNY